MLRHLSISNYVLIRELDMDFPSGLNIITGETGAGKSIMLGALSLLMGKKADMSVFSDNTRNCVIEGEFEVEGKETIVRRVISPSGRSRSFVNDEPVTVADLVGISSSLIDIHEQHQSRLLDSPEYQLQILDGFCSNENLLAEYGALWNLLQSKKGELRKLKEAIAEASLDKDYRQFQFDQLSGASLRDGELEEIEDEQRLLSNAETIKNELLYSAGTMENEECSISGILKDVTSSLFKVEKFIPEVSELSRRMTEARIELEDIRSDIESICDKVNVSPRRLAEVEERMDTIYSLLKKHNVSDVATLITLRDSLEKSLESTDDDRRKEGELEAEIIGLEQEVYLKASLLSQKRKNAAESFSQELQTCIRQLEMPYATFRVSVENREVPGSAGYDTVKFLFSANSGTTGGELSKVASGGELSRVMLSLKKVISEYAPLPTMIFDEIDTGVSGRMADRMGKLISGMGEKMQIFAITHLPQIASQDGTHFLIEKHSDESGSRTEIRRLSDDERVNEIARMLSGDSLSDAAVENARTLLRENKK